MIPPSYSASATGFAAFQRVQYHPAVPTAAVTTRPSPVSASCSDSEFVQRRAALARRLTASAVSPGRRRRRSPRGRRRLSINTLSSCCASATGSPPSSRAQYTRPSSPPVTTRASPVSASCAIPASVCASATGLPPSSRAQYHPLHPTRRSLTRPSPVSASARHRHRARERNRLAALQSRAYQPGRRNRRLQRGRHLSAPDAEYAFVRASATGSPPSRRVAVHPGRRRRRLSRGRRPSAPAPDVDLRAARALSSSSPYSARSHPGRRSRRNHTVVAVSASFQTPSHRARERYRLAVLQRTQYTRPSLPPVTTRPSRSAPAPHPAFVRASATSSPSSSETQSTWPSSHRSQRGRRSSVPVPHITRVRCAPAPPARRHPVARSSPGHRRRQSPRGRRRSAPAD